MAIVQNNMIPLVQLGIPLIRKNAKLIEAMIMANTEMIIPAFECFK